MAKLFGWTIPISIKMERVERHKETMAALWNLNDKSFRFVQWLIVWSLLAAAAVKLKSTYLAIICVVLGFNMYQYVSNLFQYRYKLYYKGIRIGDSNFLTRLVVQTIFASLISLPLAYGAYIVAKHVLNDLMQMRAS